MSTLAQSLFGHFASHHSPTRERRELSLFKPVAGGPQGQGIPEEQEARNSQPPKETSSTVPRTIHTKRNDLAGTLGSNTIAESLNDTDTLTSANDPEIESIRAKTRERLTVVMKALGQPDSINHSLLQSPSLPIEQILPSKRDEVESLLSGKTLDVFEAIKKVEALERFRGNIRRRDFHESSETEGNKGIYRRDTGEIIVRPNLQEGTRDNVLEHERGHRIAHTFERELMPNFFQETYDRLREKLSSSGQTFAELLATLNRANPKYKLYQQQTDGDLTGILTEELMNRHADFIARRDTGSFTDVHERELFEILEQNPFIPGTQTYKNSGPGNQNNIRASADGAELTTAPEEDREQALTGNKVLGMNMQLQGKADETKGLYLSVVALEPGSEWAHEAEKGITQINNFMGSLREIGDLLERIDAWEENKTTPVDFKKILTDVRHDDQSHHVDDVLHEQGLTNDTWHSASAAQRQTAIGEINRRVGLPSILKTLNDPLVKNIAVFDAAKKSIGEILNTMHEEERKRIPTKRIGNWLGINFYSINQVISVYQKVKKSYEDAWQERNTRMEAELTSDIAPLIPRWPFGESVRHALLRSSDDELAKPDEAELKYLQENRMHFSDLFKDGGRMDTMIQNPSTTKKALAILEYAAERGWLYDLRKNDLTHGEGPKYLLGKYNLYELLPAHWSNSRKHEWYSTLSSKNTGGIEHEIDHEYKAVHSIDKAHMFVEKFAHELHHLNYWGAIGIAKRALERGLAGEIGPWLAATFMDHLDHNPEARRYGQNREIFDKLGLLTFTNSFSTLSYFKWNRDDFLSYAENPSMKLEHTGALGKTFSLLKEEIHHKAPHMESAEMNRVIARIMAGQLVEVPGGSGEYMSIFHPRYSPFNRGSGNQSSIDVSKEDPDYYTNISDTIHADETVVKAIFGITGSGYFQLKEKAGYMAERYIEVYELHKAKGLHDEAEFFREVIKSKLNRALEAIMRDTRSQSSVGERFGIKSPHNGKSILVELVERGLIDFKLIDDGYYGRMGAHPTFVHAFLKEAFKDRNVFMGHNKAEYPNALPN